MRECEAWALRSRFICGVVAARELQREAGGACGVRGGCGWREVAGLSDQEDVEPVAIDADRGIVPGVLQRFGDGGFWENVDQVFLAIRLGVLAEFVQ